MDTVDVLSRATQHTHEHLAARFAAVSRMRRTPGQPRKAFELIDPFLALASKHLTAVEAVLLPTARRRLPDGSHVVHEHVHASKALELALAHVKAREYGSVYEVSRPWREVWADVGEALERHRASEAALVERLAEVLPPAQVQRLTDRLHGAETAAPSRPHPYAPHVGLPALVARKVLHAVDSFWDTAEGRMVPDPPRPPHQEPGRMTQYLLADPRFDEER